MSRPFLLLSILFICCCVAVGQTVTEPKKTEEDEKLLKTAIAFLRETSADVDRMRSAENRLSFSAELASLMWLHDEKTARGMYMGAISDFKLLLGNLEMQMNSTSMISEGEDPGFSLFGPSSSMVERKIRIALMVRQQIAMGLAEHDPDMAFGFLYETAAVISNPKFGESNARSDRQLEAELIKQIAEKNASKALSYGKTSLKDGVDGTHIDLLKKIYEKDPEKGLEFGQAILSKIKSDNAGVENWVYSSLLTYASNSLDASKKANAKKPVYSEGDVRDIADLFAQALLSPTAENDGYSAPQFVYQIEKYSPGRAAQIRTKYKVPASDSSVKNMALAANTAAMAANMAANSMRNSNSAGQHEDANARGIAEREKEMAEGVKSLSKSLPKEERDKIVSRARTIISQTRGTEAKIAGLSLLAAQVAKAGDTELADEIMRDAERLINPFPKNYREYLLSWLLVSGYAEANPAKAFPLLESTIIRANDTISAFVKVAEFIDVNEEMVSDGEVQVGAFGGTMLRSMTRELGIANVTLISLAKADFDKTKAITESFDRIEVRVLAKMLVLRALLDEKKPAAVPDAEVTSVEVITSSN